MTAVGGEIRVIGSDLLGPDFARAATDFARRSGQTMRLDLHGTRPGVEALIDGRADLGLFLLPPAEPPPGDPLTTRIVGWQVAVVAVSEKMPVEQLTLSQLRQAFSQRAGGEVAHWGQLGAGGAWSEQPVRPLALASEAGLAWPHLRSLFRTANHDDLLVRFEKEPARLADILHADPSAIAVAGVSLAAEPGLRLVALAAEPDQPAYLPTPEVVSTGRYPLRMPLWVAFRRAEAPRLLPFLRFLLGPEAAQALTGADFMPLPAGERSRLVFEFEEMR